MYVVSIVIRAMVVLPKPDGFLVQEKKYVLVMVPVAVASLDRQLS